MNFAARRWLFAEKERNANMSKVKNPKRRCRICGNKCEKQMRYCKLCAREVKEIRARRKGIYFTPKAAIDVVRGQAADIVTMNPPLTMGGYLGDLLPVVKGGVD